MNHFTDLYNEFVHMHMVVYLLNAELVVRVKYKMVQPYTM